VVRVLAPRLGEQHGAAVRPPRRRVQPHAPAEDLPVLARLDVQQVDIEVDAVALRRRVDDAPAVAREVAEHAERVGRREQLAFPRAVRRDQVEALALVAAAVHAVDDPVAGRRPGVERHRLAERELARPAARRVHHPELRRAADLRAEREPPAVRRERRRRRGAHVQEPADVRVAVAGEPDLDGHRLRDVVLVGRGRDLCESAVRRQDSRRGHGDPGKRGCKGGPGHGLPAIGRCGHPSVLGRVYPATSPKRQRVTTIRPLSPESRRRAGAACKMPPRETCAKRLEWERRVRADGSRPEPGEPGQTSGEAARCERYGALSQVAALLVAATGVVVLAGWALDSGALKRVQDGYMAMVPLTALGLGLAGLSLLLLGPTRVGRARRYAGIVLAALLLLLG